MACHLVAIQSLADVQYSWFLIQDFTVFKTTFF